MTATQQVTEFDLQLGHAAMAPEVLVGAGEAPLPAATQNLLMRVVVDLHHSLPGVFELTFIDKTGSVLEDAGLKLGTPVKVQAGVMNETSSLPLIEGEVTTIEGSYSMRNQLTTVRGCTLDHRLQRLRQTRNFLQGKDSDVARTLASDAGLRVGTIDPTGQVHPQLTQDNQTSWQFLRERAEELGYEVGMENGAFYFRNAGTATESTSVPVTLGKTLLDFEPKVSSAGLAPEVEVRAWDPVNAQALAVKKPVTSTGVSIGAGDAAAAAKLFVKASAPAKPASGDLGPAPSAQAHVVWDRAVTVESKSTQALGDTATSLADRIASGFAEAEAELLGDARVVAGTVLDVSNVPTAFAGKWTVSRARHVFDHVHGGGYRTWVTVSGRQDRSTVALAGGEGGLGNQQGPTRISGVVGGVVTDIADPLGLGRVKIALPWLSPDYETSWAPVTQLTAGKVSGAMFLPEPGDQVLLAFEFGDLRRPYVLGSIVNQRTGAGGMLEPGGDQPGKAVVKAGHPASVVRRGFVSPTGSRLVFHDELPPGGGKPTASQIVLGTEGNKLGLVIDPVAGSFTLACKPGSPPGKLTIECDGNVEIKAGTSGALTIDGGQSLTLKGKAVQIEATGPAAIKGKPIQLN